MRASIDVIVVVNWISCDFSKTGLTHSNHSSYPQLLLASSGLGRRAVLYVYNILPRLVLNPRDTNGECQCPLVLLHRLSGTFADVLLYRKL